MFPTVLLVLVAVLAGWVLGTRWPARPRARAAAEGAVPQPVSTDLLHAVVDSSTGVAIIATRPDGLITLFNPGAEQMLGYASAEMTGHRTPLCLHLDSELTAHGSELSQSLGRPVTGFDVLVAMVRSGDSHECRSWTYVRKDGSQIGVSLTVSAIHDKVGGVAGFLCIATDISPLRALEDELSISQLRFHNAFETASHGMALVSPDGRWLEVNKALCDMLGYSREQLLALDFQTITHQDDLGLDLALVEALLVGALPSYQMEKRYRHASGRLVHILLSVSLVRDRQGRPLYFVSQVQDMTARKEAEDVVRASENYLRTIMDNVVDAIITIDEHGLIESFNHAAERMFGYSEDVVKGRNISCLMPEPYRSQHDGYLARYLLTGQARVIGIGREVEGQRADGSTFQMELQVSGLNFVGQRKFVGVVRDITVRKRVERMKDEFVSTVSHELRTPLTAVAGSLELVASGALGPLAPTQQDVLDIACRNSLRLTHLINDLLDMDKLVSGNLDFDMRPQALMPLVRDALVLNQSYADQFSVRFELTAVFECQVLVDAKRLQQILANYLSNAAKFAPANSVVTVAVEDRGTRVRIVVTDTGPGIPEVLRDRLFTKFSQIDASDSRPRSGTGLGLAISRELAERMHGQVGCDCSHEVGTAFYLELPRS